MSIIRVEIDINAPAAVCFDMARSVDAHVESARATGERAVGGVTSGMLNLGDEVTWRARHFGVTQDLTSRIVAFDRPHHFRDEMVRGAFRRIVHDHYFEPAAGGTACATSSTSPRRWAARHACGSDWSSLRI